MTIQRLASTAILGGIVIAILLRWIEPEPPITEQQVRDGNRQRIERMQDDLRAELAQTDSDLAELRDRYYDERERACEHLIGSVRGYAECIGVPVSEWCDLSAGDRAVFISMGVTGRSCQEAE